MKETALVFLPFPFQHKDECEQYGRDIISRFCKLNKIDQPIITNKKCDPRYYGFYSYGSNEIVYDKKQCRVSVNVPGFQWAYTGYKADVTVAGILSHEMGHYVDDYFGYPSQRIKRFVRKEKSVSSYEPDGCEIFAEAFRLFLLNPNLLQLACPRRYEFLTEKCCRNLIPFFETSWDVNLRNAHPRILDAASNWICRK